MLFLYRHFFFIVATSFNIPPVHTSMYKCVMGAARTDGCQAMKYMMDTDDLANKLRQFTLVAVVVKVGAVPAVVLVCAFCVSAGACVCPAVAVVVATAAAAAAAAVLLL